MKRGSMWFGGVMVTMSLLFGVTEASDRTAVKRQPPDIKLKSKKPYDQPKEALEYFAEMRLPEGSSTLNRAWYDEAVRDADGLQWHIAGTGALIPPDANVALNELSSWQQVGPANVGGRTRVIRFDPTNPQVMYVAAVAGGVWKSVNAGTSWTPLSDLAPNLAVSSMVIDRVNPMRIFVGTGEGVFNADAVRGNGIYVSTNGGNDFERLSSTGTTDFLYVNDLVQSPNDANTLYAVTRTGAFITRDSGATWTRFIDAFAPPTAPAKTQTAGCFDIDAANNGSKDDVLVACGSFQAFLATDSGAVYRNDDALNAGIWTPVLQPANMARTSLARSASAPGTIYALAAGFGVSTQIWDGLLGVWRSTDYGATWTNRLTNDSTANNNNALLSNPVYFRFSACGYGADQPLNQGWYDNVIAVDPVDPDRIWVGGIDLWRSDDGGQNFGIASYWWFGEGDPNYAHADQHVIAFHPSYDGTSNQTMYVGNDGGIQRTDNAAAIVGTDNSATPSNSLCGNENFPDVTWTPLNNGYAVTQFYHGSVMPDNQTYFAGAQDNGTQLGSSSSLAWTEIFGGDGAYTAVNPENPQQLYLANTGFSIRRSDDGGATSTRKTTGITSDTGMFITPFLMDPNNPNRLWMGGRTMWRTDNSAELWTQASTSLMVPTSPSPFTSSHKFSSQAVAPGLADLVLGGTSQGRIYRTTTATTATSSTAWTFSPSATGATGSRVRPGAVADLAFNPAETGTNPDTRTAIAVFSTFNGAGNPNDPHVFRSTDGGQTWAGIDGTGTSKLPNIPVHSVAIDPTSPGGSRIFVGTDIGVFVTTDTGATWRRENTGFANTVVEELLLQRNAVSGALELFAFTHGRSAYKTVVAEANPPVPTAIDIAAKSATPASLNAGSNVVLTAQITLGTLPDSTAVSVTIDLTSIGGSASTAMVDDGTNGDATADDGIFSVSHTIPVSTTAGAKAMLVSVSDAQGRTDTDAIALTLSPAPDDLFEDGFEDLN